MDFLAAALEFTDMPIRDALKSENSIIRILAVMDRRVGRRTLQGLDENSFPEWARIFYRLRISSATLNGKFEQRGITMEEFARTERLLGESAMERLSECHAAVFGIGGVGGHAAEALVRSGIGALDIVDGDEVAASNINRQIIALHSTVGLPKTCAAEARFIDINPALRLTKFQLRLSEETVGQFDFSRYDYVIDAIDDVRAKVLLAVKCREAGTPLISSMGTGNKLDPTKFRVSDIYETSVCPLARVMRHELKKHGIERLKVVWSTELPAAPTKEGERVVPASCAFVPSVAGLIIAGEVVRELIGT